MQENYEFTPPVPEQEQERPDHQGNRQSAGHGKCDIWGCPKPGHMNFGVWKCRYHEGRKGEQIAKITLALKNHSAAFDWYETLLTTTIVEFDYPSFKKKIPPAYQPKAGESWQDYKKRFKGHLDKLMGVNHAA